MRVVWGWGVEGGLIDGVGVRGARVVWIGFGRVVAGWVVGAVLDGGWR